MEKITKIFSLMETERTKCLAGSIYIFMYLCIKLCMKFYVHVTVHRNKFIFNKTNRRTHQFPKFIFVKKLYMFQAVSLPIIRSSPLYIRHWYMSCRFDDSFQAGPSLYISVECTVENS